MSYAYTPGLKVLRNTIIRKRRVLPIPGEVLVQKGDSVSYSTIVARTFLPSEVTISPAAYILGVEPPELPKLMMKKVGDQVEKGELLAISKSFFGLFKTELRAEESGTIELISPVTGQVVIRKPPVSLNLNAYISGKIVEVIPKIGVVVETVGALVQGIFGIGGERHGELMTVAEPDEVLTPEHINDECAGKIIVGGSLITFNALKKAEKKNVKGIVVGGVKKSDLSRYLGYELGVAITGHENISLTCIITEGFGEMAMANHTYHLLDSLNGKIASINGATQIRAGVIRPEVIIPREKVEGEILEEESRLHYGMAIGTRVRIIRRPYFGKFGNVVDLPIELQEIETESKVRVVEVELDDGSRVIVPRANVEIIEE